MSVESSVAPPTGWSSLKLFRIRPCCQSNMWSHGPRLPVSAAAVTFVLFLCQDVRGAVPPDDQLVAPCSISAEPVSSSESITVRIRTSGRNCSFILTSLDNGTEQTDCRKGRGSNVEAGANEDGGGGREDKAEEVGSNSLEPLQLSVEEGRKEREEEEEFTCVLHHLEAGTWYQLQVRSQTDQQLKNISCHTSRSSPGPSPTGSQSTCPDVFTHKYTSE